MSYPYYPNSNPSPNTPYPYPQSNYPQPQPYPGSTYPNSYPQPQPYNPNSYAQPNQYNPPVNQPQYPQTYPTPQSYPPQPQQNKPNFWFNSYYNQIPPQEMGNLQAWFYSVDRDRSGSISASELAVMPLGREQLGLETARKLIKAFDRNYSGNIDFYEYAALNQFIGQIQTAFYTADTDRSGYLSQQEIYNALVKAGFQCSLPTIQAMCQKYDSGYGVSLNSFLQLTAHLATVRTLFEYNDPQRTGRVSLTYDQLAHITIHLMEDKKQL